MFVVSAVLPAASAQAIKAGSPRMPVVTRDITPSPDSASQCSTDTSCQWASLDYTGDYDHYATYFADFADAKNDDGECQAEGYTGWNDCALSTYDAHTTCTSDWYTNANYEGNLLPDTPESGSADLYSTYKGDFANQLSSVIAVTC